MSESYLFKHIDVTNTRTLTIFRMTRPLGYLIAPVLATIFLVFFPFQYLFVAIGTFMLIGIIPASIIVDTR